MSAARRAAVFASLTTEPQLAYHAADAAALDEFCALAAALERARVNDATLAAASADEDAPLSAVARAMLRARALMPAAAPADEAGAPRVVEAPRAYLRALGAAAPAAAALLRAAFATDDEPLIAALSDRFDRAELRGAQRLAGLKTLRGGLRTSGAAFRGIASRELAMEWSERLDAIRRCARRKRNALRTAVTAAGGQREVAEQAASADAVWDALDEAPPISVRVGLLHDALVARQDATARLVPIGSAFVPSARLAFDDASASPIDLDAFAAALGVQAGDLRPPIERSAMAVSDAAAARLISDSAGQRDGMAALSWPVAEMPARVIAPAMTFSASRLNVFADCPRRFFYEYLCGAVEERATANALYGKVVHGALEALHRDVRVPSRWDAKEVLGRFTEALDAAFGLARGEFGSELEYAVARVRARRVAEHYVRWLYEEAADAAFEIVDIESRQRLIAGGNHFVGYIDRIDKPLGGGPITIYDYKTGRIPEDPKEYIRAVRSGDEAQLALYYAMRRAQGDAVARIALVSIRDARERTWALALDIVDAAGAPVAARRERDGVVRATCSTDDLAKSMAALIARCDLLGRDGLEHFAVGADPPCSFCSYVDACRERPADGERIFAR